MAPVHPDDTPPPPDTGPKQTIDSIRAAVQTQLAEAEEEVARLRQQRDKISLSIRDAVQARDEIAKIYSQLQPKTPRTRKPKSEAAK